MSKKRPELCCFLHNNDVKRPCKRVAEWFIWAPPDPYNYTVACTEHVGDLLWDATEFRVYPMDFAPDP